MFFGNDLAETTQRNMIQALETEKYLRTLKPYKRPHKDRYMTMMSFHLMSEDIKSKHFKANEREVKMTTSVAAKKSCLKKLDELKPILLREMLVNQTHTGHYLICRTLVEPVFQTGMMLLAEDEEGNIEQVTIYNYSMSYDIDPATLIPCNSVMIVKEPSLKPTLDRLNFQIRVESPSDIQIVTHFHCIEKWKDTSVDQLTYEDLNRRGNASFVKKNYHEATRWYLLALNKEKQAKTYANLSAAYLALEKYHSAFESARSAYELAEKNEKALFRMARACYEMRDFQQANEYFVKCLSVNSESKEARDYLNLVDKRLAEEKTGHYDIKHLLGESKRGVLRLDVADYQSSDISVVDIEGKGKGVKATQPIKRGTLIMATKATSIAYESEFNFFLMSTNTVTKLGHTTSDGMNITKTLHKMYNEPALARQVYKLYAGPNHNRDEQLDDCVLDVARVEAIHDYNAFKSCAIEANGMDTSDNAGLWVKASYFNHACVKNTQMFYIQDFQLIYSSRDIAAGEEVTISYVPQDPYEDRLSKLVKHGIKCSCELCTLDKDDKERKSREQLIKSTAALPFTEPKHIAQFERTIRDIKLKFTNRKKLQYKLHYALGNLSTCYTHCGLTAKAIATLKTALIVAKDFDDGRQWFKNVFLRFIAQLKSSPQAEACFAMAYEHFVGHRELFFHLCRLENVELTRFAHLIQSLE